MVDLCGVLTSPALSAALARIVMSDSALVAPVTHQERAHLEVWAFGE